jgi:hypothetical protein
LAFRRAAQYFFIRSETAFFSAADIARRRRRRGRSVPVVACADAPLLRPLAALRLPAGALPRKPGNAALIASISAWSSASLTAAPRAASWFMSNWVGTNKILPRLDKTRQDFTPDHIA